MRLDKRHYALLGARAPINHITRNRRRPKPNALPFSLKGLGEVRVIGLCLVYSGGVRRRFAQCDQGEGMVAQTGRDRRIAL